MADLAAITPGRDLLPVEHGRARLSERPPAAITSVMGLANRAISLPAPGTSRIDGDRLWLWSGRNRAFVLGPAPDAPGCAVTDQSDAWAVLRLDGPDAAAVLARLTPLDLSVRDFPEGATARTLLSHAHALFHRAEDAAFDILVFRSMTGWVVDEIAGAMRGVAARATL